MAGPMGNATRTSPIGPEVAAVALRLPRPRRAGVRPDVRVRASVAPLYAALLVAARRVPPSIYVETQILVPWGLLPAGGKTSATARLYRTLAGRNDGGIG